MSEGDIERIDGVQYVAVWDGKVRVVFEHNAKSDAIQRVEDITQCSGKIGATQEHLACIDYPEQCLETEADRDG